ncbi:MAG: aldo/keto reductase [Burkholderiales bacterium]|jgi:aryl-alcohol dehydrogenase-like predicted oxidoreductase|nr:aldo/keto reductase [Burkholderiales bacterium]
MTHRLFSRREWLKRTALATAGLMTNAHAADLPLAARRIPKSGEAIPVVGLGTWQTFDVAGNATGVAEARDALSRFVALGGRVVDSSPMYGSSEAVLGDLAANLGVQDRLWIATKVWTTGREAGLRQMADSMAKLRVARLDLMQVHNLVDADRHLETLAQWKQAGRIRYVGITHYHAGAYAEVERYVARGELDFLQINYSLAERDAAKRLLPLAAETRTAVIVNRPFAEGALFASVRGKPLPAWAAEIGCASWAQVFLKWILAEPAVTCAIPGTRNARHVADNLAAGRGPMPDAAARKRIEAHLDGL